MQKRFTDIFIQRPVFATCISLLIFTAGIVSFFKMDVRLYPKIDTSIVNIIIEYPGANSEVMEGFVATPIEQAISSVDGIDYITSQSIQGLTTITANLNLGYDVNTALTDITNQVEAVRGELPQGIYDPVITKQSPDFPMQWFTASSTSMDQKQLTDYLIRVIQPQIQTIDGVAIAKILGGREYAMRIWLDPYQMAAHNVTASDVFNAVKTQNIIAPAGSLKDKFQQINLYSSTDLKNAKQFDNLVIRKDSSGNLVRIKDIGEATLGAQNMDFSATVNGQNTIFLSVYAKPNTNILNVGKKITKILPHIKENLPKGTTFNSFFDTTKFIKVSIKDVVTTILEACVFVFIVIFLMLGSLRTVLIPIVTIPLSLAGACIIMLAFHFSINTITLLAFVLAIGLVVDDSIVVSENIHRHLEYGQSSKQAALTGAREISFAVIAMTLTLVAVYAPIGFMTGLTGQLFIEFAFALAGAVLVSGFVALTLSPMMCSKIYQSGKNLQVEFSGYADKIFSKLRDSYKKLLRIIIKFRYLVVIGALIIYGCAYLLYAITQHDLAPNEDHGVLLTIMKGPGSANLDYMEQRSAKLALIYKTLIPEMDGYMIVNGFLGTNSVFSLIKLKDWDQRKRTSMQIRNSLFAPIWAIPGIEAFPVIPPTIPGTGGFTPVELVLSTLGDYQDLEKESNKFIQEAQQWGGLVNINNDLSIDQPQVNINIDRDRAADLGINMDQISLSLNTFLSKPRINYLNIKGRSYEVLPQLYRKYRDIPDALNILNVQTQSGEMVPLSNLVNLKEEIIPESINHFQQLRSATIKANLAPGVSLGTALSYLSNLAKKTLPQNIHIDYSHESRQYIQTAGTITGLFIFALIFIYLVLAAQFESFRDPFIIMLTVPLAFAGALLGIHICHGTLNIYTEIGLVTLIGLITKNGILIVEFANQQQRRGLSLHDAIIEGAATRMRPILMTTSAIILAGLPLAMATGAGAVSRSQMGFVIIFGMGIGTLFTLFVIPAMYSILASEIKPVSEEKK
jgi:multidrug efflux pump